MFCKNCGKEIPDGANVCPNCGQAPNGPAPVQPGGNPDDGKGLSIAALVLGICGCALFWFSVANVIILAANILGIIFGIKGRKKSMAAYGKASGIATAGLVLSIIGTSICGIGVLSCTVCVGCTACAAQGALSELPNYLQ